MRKLISFLLCIVFATGLYSQNYNSDKLRQKCLLLRRFLELKHYKPRVWDDSSSSLLFDKWMSVLDEDKEYFIKTDIDELNTYRYKLSDEMTGKSWGFFDRSMALYKKRLLMTDSIMNSILNKLPDFSKPDIIHLPFVSYASSVQELSQRWQQALKWKILDRILDEEDDDSLNEFTEKIPANFNKLESEAINKIKKQHAARMQDELSPSPYFENNLADKYLDAICWCYDPHSNYMNLSTKKEFETEVSKFEYSVGIDIKKNDKGEWEIGKLTPGGTAWHDGQLHQGDVLLKIKSGDHPEEALSDLGEARVVAMLEGVSDDKLIVSIRAKDGNQKSVTLTKRKIEDDESIVKSYVLGDTKKVGYIKLPGFYTDEEDTTYDKVNGCANDVAKEIVKLRKDTIQGLILDLRYNGGGDVWEAVELAGIFIDIGSICSMKDKSGKVHFLKDPNRGTIYDGPLIVMVNSESASASELTSAALQDYNRALIVGNNTYGKGTAQKVVPLDTTGKEDPNATDYVKVTGAKFYRIDGSTTQWKGVIPDISFPDFYIPDKYFEKGELSALQPDNSKAAYYDALPVIPVSQLRQMSDARVSKDSSFIKIKKIADWIKQYNTNINLLLQWPSFFSFTKKAEEFYADIEGKNEKSNAGITVLNNKLDNERISLEDESGKETNDTFLQQIANDDYIRESYNIMLDWIKIKK